MTTPAPTLNAWLDEWLTLQRSQLKPSNIKSYTATARAYLRPSLGPYRLDELTTRLITTTLADLMHHGGRGGRRLSPPEDRPARQRFQINSPHVTASSARPSSTQG